MGYLEKMQRFIEEERARTNDICNVSGLTTKERYCMDLLMDAYTVFLKMERGHPDEMRKFVDAVHEIQDILAVRVVGRTYPEYWKNCTPTKLGGK